MDQGIFTGEDLRQIKRYGLTVEKVQKHLHLFRMSPPYLKLLRPCTIEDGIKLINKERMQALVETYGRETFKGRCLKFVPASGAASRMFKTFLQFLNQEREIRREHIEARAQAGHIEEQELLEFINCTKGFAFFEDLKSMMSKKHYNINTLLEKGQVTEIMRFLLTEEGLSYANLPKGLLKFHKYPSKNRTAFEEHLAEAAFYVADRNRRCRLHFTVSQQHLERFNSLLREVKSFYEQTYDVSYDVTFSVQKRSTDTLAVDLSNRPFRQLDGRLLFRPGGHGSLIENLDDLNGDIIFIKNIDNVVPDRLKVTTFEWKKILGGYLIVMQNKISRYMENLSSGAANELFFDEVSAFVRDELSLTLPSFIKGASPGEKRAFFIEKLNRPIRVCGMVRNEGEPGGGPFWVQDQLGESSLQIVETAQIDPNSKDQQAILTSSTHFNPVDLVCGVRDWQGRPFDLRRYVDPNAVFIAQKSKDGKDLKALEHPGLWNGAMARWITIFVEVPGITFNPIKTVNDLLRWEHQPG